MSEAIQEIHEAELPAEVKGLWQKAVSAVQVGNHSYAVTIIQAIMKELPGFVDGRRVLRKCMLASVQKSGGVKKGLLSSGPSIGKASSTAKKDPVAALPLLEKELEKDPGNAGANELLFDIALKLGLAETAAFALETVRQMYPENTKVLHKLADHYLATEQPAKAAEVYTDISKQDPTDSIAVKGAKDATAKASMKKGGWGGDGGPQKKDEAEAQALEAASRTGLTREQLEGRRDELAAQYAADMNNIRVVKDLADVYEQLEDWANAQMFYDWAFQISNGDSSLKTKAGEMKARLAVSELDDLRAALEADPSNEEAKARLAELEQSTSKETLKDAKERVENNPTDPKLRYELGLAHYNCGEYSEAIPHLQQATRNPHIRIKVLLLLGRTFEKKGMLDLAIKQLTDANAELKLMDGTKKEILYALGLILDTKGEKDESIAMFKQIYEIDYGYRDVANRVESAYS